MIRLRKLEPYDLPYLYQWENDSAAWADGANHHPLSQQDLRDYISSTTGDIYKDGQLRMIVVSSYDEASVETTLGCVDLVNFDPRNRKAELAIYIAPDVRRRGYASEALMAVEQLAFRNLGLRLLYAFVSARNKAAMALFSRAGYVSSMPIFNWTLEGEAHLLTKTVCND